MMISELLMPTGISSSQDLEYNSFIFLQTIVSHVFLLLLHFHLFNFSK